MATLIKGIKKDSSDDVLNREIKELFLEITGNLKWLKKGQTVYLKPALNSPRKYPATTYPGVIKVVAEEIRKRGGNVIVGDQSGIGHVLSDKNGVVRGSSLDCYIKSGMSSSGEVFIPFEEGDWKNDFIKIKTKETGNWPHGFYVAKKVVEADHIIALPRIATHAQAGVTLGYKNMVGILREDSRVEFHKKGPLNSFIKSSANGANFDVKHEDSGEFFSKIVEISASIKNKIRATLFVGTKCIANYGPDNGYIAKSDTGVLIASDDMFSAEVVALAYLTYVYESIPFVEKIKQKVIVRANGKIEELGKSSVWENGFIKHALQLGWGKKDFVLSYKDIPASMKEKLGKLLR